MLFFLRMPMYYIDPTILPVAHKLAKELGISVDRVENALFDSLVSLSNKELAYFVSYLSHLVSSRLSLCGDRQEGEVQDA